MIEQCSGDPYVAVVAAGPEYFTRRVRNRTRASRDDGEEGGGGDALRPAATPRAAAARVEDMPACGHRFHAECVLALQRSGVNNLCPLCRAAMPESADTMCEDAQTLKVRADKGKVDGATYRMLKEAATAKLREAVARDPNHSWALNELAFELEDQGKYKQAGPLYRRALELGPKKYGDPPHPGLGTATGYYM